MVPRRYKFKRCTRMAVRSHNFTVGMARCKRKFFANNFFSRASRLQNSPLASRSQVNFQILNAISIFDLQFSIPLLFLRNNILFIFISLMDLLRFLCEMIKK